MDDYFIITQTSNEVHTLTYIALCTEVDMLEWGKSNKYRFHVWREVTDGISEYYSDYYKLDTAFHEISDLKRIGTVQKYLNHIDRLNAYAKISNQHLINIILNCITPRLRQAMAHYKDLHSDLSKWKE